MKQKFSILFDEANDKLIIREYAELDKEIMSLLCEESYDKEAVGSAIEQGIKDLVSVLRTKNLYPPEMFAEKIAEAVMDLYQTGGTEIVELRFDDLDLMVEEKAEENIEGLDDEAKEIDDLLEDDVDEDFEDDLEIKSIKSPLKVADEDGMDSGEDS